MLEDFVVFNGIASPHSGISLKGNSTIVIFGSIEFSSNHAHNLINFYDNERKYIIMKEYSIMNIINNNVQSLFTISPTVAKYPNVHCLFQYFSNNTNAVAMEKRNFLFTFYNNLCKKDLKSGCYYYIPVTHCLWLPESLFKRETPLDVNSNYMQFIDNSSVYNLSQSLHSLHCVCALINPITIVTYLI